MMTMTITVMVTVTVMVRATVPFRCVTIWYDALHHGAIPCNAGEDSTIHYKAVHAEQHGAKQQNRAEQSRAEASAAQSSTALISLGAQPKFLTAPQIATHEETQRSSRVAVNAITAKIEKAPKATYLMSYDT